jgi:soluble lytic murein transglycosylase-like protein
MNWRAMLFLLTLLAPCRVLADSIPLLSQAANQVCRQAITAAERAHGIPSHLLAAIARVESGRRDQNSGTLDPWPWTINMDGQGTFYDNKAQAVAAATAMRPRAARSIDVGCMQISLTFHPDAFADMAQAFDPASNADYGARYLVQLFGKTSSWPKAVELYHSATLEIGQDYGRRVYAAWPEEQKLAEATQPYPLTNGWASGVNRSLLSLPLRSGAPHVIPLVPGVAGGTPPGRSLASYRLTPVRIAFRGP